jgi:hypothetical protein
VCLPAGSLVVSDDGERIPRSDTAPAPGRRHVVAVESDVADGLLQVDARGARNWQA